ncbi:MAG: extensin family protein [Roseovarius sp.]
MRFIWVIPLILMGCGAFGGRDDDEVSSRGSVCGQPAIKGRVVGEVDGASAICGIENGVEVTRVGGVSLSQPAIMGCNTARVLNAWVQRDVDQIVGNMGGGVQELQVAAHYVCRTRNHKPGAKVSEHGKGRAIDISAFHLRDGSEISVLRDWGNGRRGRALRRLHESACGPFGTVLGPESDRFHQDHFHFDTANYRSGAYCR